MNNKDKFENRKTTDLQSLAQTLLPLAQDLLGKNGFVETDILTNWDEIIGGQLADFSFPQKIVFQKNKKNDGCLYLIVPSGAFAVEIQHREKYILEKINRYFGYNAVSSLKIIQNNDLDLEDYRHIKTENKQLPHLSEEQKETIKNITNEINNENLKEILIKLGHSILTDNHNSEKKKDEI